MPRGYGRAVAQARTGRRGTMEKLVYLLWKGTGPAAPAWVEHLLGPTAAQLLALGPAGLSMSVADAEAAAANVPLPRSAGRSGPGGAGVDLARLPRRPRALRSHPVRGGRSAGRLPGHRVAAHRLRRQPVVRRPATGPTASARGAWSCSRCCPSPTGWTTRPGTPTGTAPRRPMSTEIQPRTRYVRNAVARAADPRRTALPGHRRGGVAVGRARQRPHALLLRRR